MSCEIIVRKQDGTEYRKFEFPLEVMTKERSTQYYGSDEYVDKEYGLFMGFCCIGTFENKEHAIHVMNYLLTQRIRYVYEQKDKKVLILTVPTDEIVKQTPDENLLTEVPVRREADIEDTGE